MSITWIVFNIAGNTYRLVVWINYPYRVVYVRFTGTHAEYDKLPKEARWSHLRGNAKLSTIGTFDR